MAYLATLDLDLPDLGRLDEYADVIKERSIRRDLIVDVQRTLLEAASTARPVHELLADVRDSADRLLGHASRGCWQTAGDVVDRLLLTLEDGHGEAFCGLTSGFPGWDRLSPGLLPGGLYRRWQARHGQEAPEARELAASLLPFWEGVAYREDGRSLFGSALRVADGLATPELAASLLQPFQVEALTPEEAPPLVALTRRYGESWWGQLLSAWSGDRHRGPRLDERERLSWLAALPRLCKALRAADEAVGSAVARLLLRDRWEELQVVIGEARRHAQPSLRDKAVAALSAPLHGLLGSAGAVAADDFRDEVVAALCTAENEPLLPCLVQVVRAAAKEKAQPGRSAAPALAALTRHCIGRLEARLARPARSAGDWSIALPDGCRCELCSRLGAFLSDPVRQRLEWPLAQQSRGHIHQRIDASELPVHHETRRSGRPYTLILSKTGELFEREARERRSWQSDLARFGRLGAG